MFVSIDYLPKMEIKDNAMTSQAKHRARILRDRTSFLRELSSHRAKKYLKESLLVSILIALLIDIVVAHCANHLVANR